MSNEETQNQPKINADRGSISTGFEVGGNLENSKVEVHNVINNYASPEPVKSPDLNETIETEYWEPETILIPAGSFWLGSDGGEEVPVYETPRHQVPLLAYRIGLRPVTNKQYEYFIRQVERSVSPILGWAGKSVLAGHEEQPVLGVTWDDAKRYCEWISNETKRNYSLPNEAQWEKACREMYAGLEFPVNVLEWTCSLWGEKRIVPDLAYYYPWKDDGRNDPNANRQIRRVMRSCTIEEKTTSSNCTARMGRSTNDPGSAEAPHSFRVVLAI